MRGALAAAVVAALTATALAPLLRADDDARAMVLRMIDRTVARDEQGAMVWTIHEADGATKRRRLTYRQKTAEGGRQLILFRLLEPPELRRTAVLSISGGGKPAAQWIYLPDRRRTRRIAEGDGAERFLGSDFSYEDLKAEDAAASEYRLLRREGLDGEPCDVVEARPAADRAADAAYPRRVLWIRARDSFALRTELYGRDGALAKSLRASEIVEVGKYSRANRLEMTSATGGTRTVVQVLERKIDAGIADHVFSERELEEGR
jgi:hypothetical protein